MKHTGTNQFIQICIDCDLIVKAEPGIPTEDSIHRTCNSVTQTPILTTSSDVKVMVTSSLEQECLTQNNRRKKEGRKEGTKWRVNILTRKVRGQAGPSSA